MQTQTAAAAAAHANNTAALGVRHIDHVNLTVSDLDASVDWYGRVFGFVVVEGGLHASSNTRFAIVKSGDAMLALYEVKGRHVPDRAERARLGVHGMVHFSLRVANKAALEATLQREGVVVDHYTRYPHSDSFYVNDVDGYEIEVSCWDDDVIRFS